MEHSGPIHAVQAKAFRRSGAWKKYLADIAILSVTSMGGPQVHIGMFIDRLVRRGKYLNEAELMELYGLCQVLPGPTSTQTLTAISFKLGGTFVAYLALLIWISPAVLLMLLAAFSISFFNTNHISLGFIRFMVPVAIGFMARSAYKVNSIVIKGKQSLGIMLLAMLTGFFYPSPFVSPALIILGGLFTGLGFSRKFAEHTGKKIKIRPIQWINIGVFFGILIGAAVIGKFTGSLPVRLFENFYRNGSIIFGGGNVLIPLMYSEFVEFKHYLTEEEFLGGFALVQVIPGPVFAFCSYIGALSMRSTGLQGQIIGGTMATIGIFLPGTLLVFFFIRLWNQLKHYKMVKASLLGINAAGAGLMISATLLMLQPYNKQPIMMAIALATILLLYFKKIPSWAIILAGLAAGLIF